MHACMVHNGENALRENALRENALRENALRENALRENALRQAPKIITVQHGPGPYASKFRI